MPSFLYENRHTSPCRRAAVKAENVASLRVVYLSVITVTITLSNALAVLVLDVLDVVVGGCGSATPTVGMFPAKIEVESRHISAIAIATGFIVCSSFEVEKDAEIPA